MTPERKAFALVCDDLMHSLTGKVSLSGVYVQDIVIPGPALLLNQLVFFFTVETPREKPFQSLTFKVSLPGNPPREQSVPIVVNEMSIGDPRRKRITFRQAMLLQQVVLMPGRIETSVIHEEGELDAGGIWIMTFEELNAAGGQQPQ
jgi:hypothetical protein